MNETKQHLIIAEQKAKELFRTVEERGLIIPGKTEKQLCDEILQRVGFARAAACDNPVMRGADALGQVHANARGENIGKRRVGKEWGRIIKLAG